MPRMIRRGDSFRAQLCVGGKVTSFTVRTGNKRVAEARMKARISELKRDADQRTRDGLSEIVSMSALLSHFQELTEREKCPGTVRSYADSIKPIRQFFVIEKGDRLTVDKVRARHIDDYLAWRRENRRIGYLQKTTKGELSARTLNKDRAILRRMFRIAERRGLCSQNPVKQTEAAKGDKREAVILSATEYDQLLMQSSHNPTLALYVLLLGETGMRCDSEALHLRWSDIHLTAAVPFLRVVSGRDGHRTKTGKSREIRLSPRLIASLREHFAAHRLGKAESAPLFQHDTGERWQRVYKAFKSAARRAQLPAGFRQHDLRHRWVTVALESGESLQDVQYEAGHASITTTMLYLQQTPTHTRKAHREALRIAV